MAQSAGCNRTWRSPTGILREERSDLSRSRSPTSKLVASGLCRLLSGFPLFSEAIQVAYSNPERTLSRKRPPRCPSSKPSSMGGRSRKNDIIDHPASLTLPPGGFTAAIANSKPTPGRVGIQDFGPSAFDSPKCVSHVQPLPHAARCGEVRASFS